MCDRGRQRGTSMRTLKLMEVALPSALACLALAVAGCGPAAAPAPPTAAPAPPTSAPAAKQAPIATPVPPPATPTAAAVATGSAVEFDRLFIDMMVPHHEAALEMARVAQERADRAEIKQLAADILRSQDAEITRMRQWRKEWFGASETPPMSRMPMLQGMPGMADATHTMDMAADVERLRMAPAPFDLAFIDAMDVHHQSAVEAARRALQRSGSPEIKDLAVDIIDAQLREIGQLRAWKLSWYGSGVQAAATVAPAGKPEHDMGTVPGEDMTGH
jgi:uncharacterized protein (DUF305 family)